MTTHEQIITALPIGKRNAKNVANIAQQLGIPPSGTNNDKTRKQVVRTVHTDDIPLGSNRSGYWLIDSDQECDEVVAALNETITIFVNKRDAIIRGWQKRKQSKNTPTPWPK